MSEERYVVKNRSGYSSEVLFTSDDEQEAIDFAIEYDKKAEVIDMKHMFQESIFKNY